MLKNIPFCSKKSFLKKTIKCFREIRFAFINRTRQPKASADLPQKNDVYITKMQTLQTSLEDYYMELKKRGAVKC